MKQTIAAVFVLLLAAVLPFWRAVGDRVLFPFHTGVIVPWSATAPEWVKQEPKNFNVGDKHSIIHPDLTLTVAQRRSGGSLLWNPNNYAGLPHAANPLTGVYYPPNLLFSIVEPLRAYALVAALHVFLAGLFTFLFLRAIDLSRPAAVLGGMGFALSGWMAVHVHHMYFVHAHTWLPLGLFAVERFLASGSRRALIGLAISIGMSFLAGFPQTAVIDAYVLAVYGAVGLVGVVRRSGRNAAAGAAGLLLLFAVIGVGLAAIQLLPTYEFSKEAGHQGQTLADLESDSLVAASLLHLGFPDLFGNPAFDEPAAINIFNVWLLGPAAATNNYSERTFYPGILVGIAALFAFSFRRRRPELTLGVLGALSIPLALATPLLGFAIKLPGLGFGSPMRFTQIAAFAFPVLAAVVFDRLFEIARTRARRFEIVATISGLPFVLAAVVFLMVLLIAPTWATGVFVRYLEANGIDAKVGAGQWSFEDKVARLKDSILGLRLAAGAILLGVAGFWFACILAGRGARTGLVCAVLAVGFVPDLTAVFVRFNRPVKREGLYSTPSPALEHLKAEADGTRLMRFGAANESWFFLPNGPQAIGLKDAQGFRALTPRRYLDFLRTVEPNPFDVGVLNLKNPASLGRPQLDLLQVGHVIAEAPIPNAPWPLVFPTKAEDAKGFFIYKNPNVFPRAFVVPRTERIESDAAVLEKLRSLPLPDAASPHPLRAVAYVAGGATMTFPPSDVDPLTTTPSVSVDRPGQITVDLGGRYSGLLVVTESFAPGWKATVVRPGSADKARAVHCADHAFLATTVDRNDFSVVFTYAPKSVGQGTTASFVALAALGLFLLPKRKRGSPPADVTAVDA